MIYVRGTWANHLHLRFLLFRLGFAFSFGRVVDHFQHLVQRDVQGTGIRSDPNNPDDPEYIVRLVGQVVRVSVETVKIVAALPQRCAPDPEAPSSAG